MVLPSSLLCISCEETNIMFGLSVKLSDVEDWCQDWKIEHNCKKCNF